MSSAWKEIPYHGASAAPAWAYLDDRLAFRPRVAPDHWPGIVEPYPSITYAIGHIYSGDAVEATQLEDDLAQKTLVAFRSCTDAHHWLYAFDWQHMCYQFYPHQPFHADGVGAWPVPVLPIGDYDIFLAQDFSFGIFGHPWEKTMCVFGQRLLNAFAQAQPILWTRIVRRNGVAV